MGRHGPNSGIGRGNGPGSKASQFKDGMPSANPEGRRLARKRALPGTIKDILNQLLTKPIVVTENGKTRTASQIEAMLEVLLASFPKSNVRERLQILKFVIALNPNQKEHEEWEPTQESVEDFVNGLRKSYEDSQMQESAEGL